MERIKEDRPITIKDDKGNLNRCIADVVSVSLPLSHVHRALGLPELHTTESLGRGPIAWKEGVSRPFHWTVSRKPLSPLPSLRPMWDGPGSRQPGGPAIGSR